MPNTKSAAKAMRQAIRRKVRNITKKDNFKAAVKEVKKLITEGKESEAVTAMKKAMSAMDKAVKTGVMHKNKSSRLKSRIAKSLAKIK
jgi:small subunit ribosomal protein S20